MNDEPTHTRDSLAPLLAALDEALAAGREPELTVPPELAGDFEAARSVLRLLNEAWPRPGPPDTTIDQAHPAPATEVPHAAPVRLGRFHVLRELGQGGFGVVYLAYDPTLARCVALKAPRSDRWATPDFRRRFLQEGRAAAHLDHPNIVRVLEADADDSAGYIASAYCEGPSLATWLCGRKDALPCRLAAALTADLAAGIHHAHERGVVHRDLKPSNVLLEIGPELEPTGLPRKVTPKICDFGLAKVLEGEQTETRPGVVMGTPQYMAPEQALGRTGEIGPAADVYSLGVILYEMLTGRPPFVGEPGLDLLRQVAAAPPERPSRRRKDVPRDLETIVLTCLEKEPGRRYASAAALEMDLRRWMEGKPPLGRPEPWRRRVGRWVRRHPVGTAAAAVLVLIAIATWLGAQYFDPEWAARQATADLASGKAVHLLGESGGPAWCRWRTGGSAATMEIRPDRPFRVDTWGESLLELLRDTGRDHYRFRADIRHENANHNGAVGIYFAHHEYPTEKGGVHSFLHISYDDIDAAASVRPANLPPDLPGMNAAGNRVMVMARYSSEPDPKLEPNWDLQATLRSPELFTAAGKAGNQWRHLVIEVRGDEIQAKWGEATAIGDSLVPTAITSVFGDLIDAKRRNQPQDPTVAKVGSDFSRRGGLGLYLRYSAASFCNVVVEPLD